MISDNIRTLRELKQMTRKEFGEKLFVSQDVINNIERGRVAPSGLMIKCICDTFNVSKTWLETGIGEPFVKTESDTLDKIAERYHSDGSDTFRAILDVYAQLTAEEQEAFESFVRKFVAEYNRSQAEQMEADFVKRLDRDDAEVLEEEARGQEKKSG